MTSFWKTVILTSLFLPNTVSASSTDLDKGPHKPTDKDKCPVCGMFVHKYPDWISEIVFTDGARVFFDGVKDMCRYRLDLEKFAPDRNPESISAIWVTEYYDMKTVGAAEALYVVGSDVFGPMGRELLPFLTREDAGVFLKDHHGTQILTWDEITPVVLQELNQ